MSVSATARVRDRSEIEQIQTLATWGFIIFVIGGIASLVSSLPVPWYAVVRRVFVGALVAIVVGFGLFVWLKAIPEKVEQIWMVPRKVVARELKSGGPFDPSKPFTIVNPDGSRWLVPSGRYVPVDPGLGEYSQFVPPEAIWQKQASPPLSGATPKQEADDDYGLSQFAPKRQQQPKSEDLGDYATLPDAVTATPSP